MVDPTIRSSLEYFIPVMCSLNCASTLQQRTVAYSLSLLYYYSQFLASKGAKDFFIQFSATVLYFNNLSTEEENVFIVLLSFFIVKRRRATKVRISEIRFFFTSFSKISNSSSLLHFNIFIYIFSVRQFCMKLT